MDDLVADIFDWFIEDNVVGILDGGDYCDEICCMVCNAHEDEILNIQNIYEVFQALFD